MYLIAFPLLLIPFTLYNIVVFILDLSFTDTLVSLPLLEGRALPVTTGELLIILAMLLLYLEVVKAARVGMKGVMDHVLALALFIGMACELALVPKAATSTLLLLTALAFVDLIVGLSVSTRRKQPELVYEDPERM